MARGGSAGGSWRRAQAVGGEGSRGHRMHAAEMLPAMNGIRHPPYTAIQRHSGSRNIRRRVRFFQQSLSLYSGAGGRCGGALRRTAARPKQSSRRGYYMNPNAHVVRFPVQVRVALAAVSPQASRQYEPGGRRSGLFAADMPFSMPPPHALLPSWCPAPAMSRPPSPPRSRSA